MEENRSKRIDTDIPSDPIPGTFQVIDVEGSERESIDRAKNDYREETAAEMTVPRVNRVNNTFTDNRNETNGVAFGGTIVGVIALILSILSLFTMPFLFGIIGIIGGFYSRSRGAKSLGSWAIGIGAVSIIVGIFILPFF
jgi:hypothetical protein